MKILNFLLLAAMTTAAPAFGGDLYLVSVGVEPYEMKAGRTDLYSRDALHVANAMDRARCRVLDSRDATPGNVLKGIAWLAQEAGTTDTTVIFFSTHGTIDRKSGYYFSLAPEGDEDESPLTAKRFNDAIASIKGNVIVLADTCQAEGLILERSKHRASFIVASKRNESSSGQYRDIRRLHGYFVIALCEGLNGAADGNEDRKVTVSELSDYISKRSHCLYRKQTAVSRLHSSHAGIVLAEYAGDRKDAVLWETEKPRNPFGCQDVLDPDHSGAAALAKKARLGSVSGPKSKEWNSKIVSGVAGSVDGRWSSGRWHLTRNLEKSTAPGRTR